MTEKEVLEKSFRDIKLGPMEGLFTLRGATERAILIAMKEFAKQEAEKAFNASRERNYKGDGHPYRMDYPLIYPSFEDYDNLKVST